MLLLFSENLLPVFLVAGVGYLLAARLDLDPRPISRVAFFILAPCFVFQLMVENELPGMALVRMLGFTLASLMLPAALAALACRLLGWSRSMTTATVLVVLLPNAGNYGLSVNLFAFGEAGLAQAGLYFVSSAILTFTVGILVASLGRARLRDSLSSLYRVPTIWAVAVSLVMIYSGWRLPTPAARAVELLAAGCIPVFLIILGMQLRGKALRGPVGPMALAGGMRLIGGATAGLLLAALFGLEGPARQAGILQSAMPSAVITIVLATEYDVEPAFVTSVVFFTTLVSPLTLTPLLAWLGA
jgi:predicted permease